MADDADARTILGVPYRMSTRARWALGIGGALSWGLGAAATLTSGNSGGSVALVAAGAGTGALALLGRWPSKVTVSGTELSWSEVRQTVDEQIDVARQQTTDRETLAQLRNLRDRLDELQRTGRIAVHPAQQYDDDVLRALEDFPRASVRENSSRRRDVADFTLQVGSRRVYVETKWKADEYSPFRGATLNKLTERLQPEDRLLVVSNSRDVRGAADQLERLLPGRAAVVSWLSSSNDAQLHEALQHLLDR